MEEETTHIVVAAPTEQRFEEEGLRMESSSRSNNQSHTSQAATKVVKTRKRKLPVVSVEDEALSPENNLQTTQDGNLRRTDLSMSKNVLSKKIVDKAVSVSHEVARTRKRNEQAMSTENDTPGPINQMDNHSSSPPTETSPVAKKIKRSRSLTSDVWNHFQEPNENDEDPTTVCIHCGKEYLCRSFHGTSNLWKHLRFHFPLAPLKDQVMRKKENGTPKQCYSYDECRRALGEMVILDEMAFRVVEGEGFVKYSNKLQPRFVVPSRITVARDIMQIFLEEKAKMKNILRKQRICLTTDTWTSNQNLNYMCLTAHWIDHSWYLQRRVINFCLVEDHKGETIGRKIEECLLEWV